MTRDAYMRRRCYSPQLKKLGMAGKLIAYERDDFVEPGRSYSTGTGKCGSAKKNFEQKVFI